MSVAYSGCGAGEGLRDMHWGLGEVRKVGLRCGTFGWGGRGGIKVKYVDHKHFFLGGGRLFMPENTQDVTINTILGEPNENVKYPKRRTTKISNRRPDKSCRSY